MFVIGCIQAILFLGGWNSPLGAYDPVYMAIGYDPVVVGERYLTGAISLAGPWNDVAVDMGLKGGAIGLVALNAYSAGILIGKAVLVVLIHMWVRWTLPRIRIDQVMHGCVKGLLPFSLAMFVGTAIWLRLLPPTSGAAAFEHGTSNLANLTGDVSTLQLIVQWICTVMGVVLFAFYLIVLGGGMLMRKRGPRQGIFPDVMPVGRDVAFTRGPDYVSEADRSLAQS
jgi:hypothetical protein